MPDDATPQQRAVAVRGLVLFTVYLLLYGGFVAVAALRPQTMAWRPLGGVNLAVWWGMALIVAPLLLAAVYMAWCRRAERT